VLSTDTNIGSGGYKTDVKFAYSAGFATFTSLNQNLAMVAARLAEHVGKEARVAAAANLNKPSPGVIAKNEAALLKDLKIKSISMLQKSADLQNEIQIAVAAEAKRLEDAAKAKIAEAEADLATQVENLGGEVAVAARIAQDAARKELAAAQAKTAEAARYAEQVKIVATKLQEISSAASQLDSAAVAAIAAEIKAAQEEEAKYTKANEEIAKAKSKAKENK